MTRTVYDWDSLLQMRSTPMTLSRGVDFPCQANTMRSLLSEAASKRRLWTLSRVRGDTITYMVVPAPTLRLDGTTPT